MADEAIEWSPTPATSRVARFGLYWLVGLFGGLAVIVVALVGGLAFSAATGRGIGLETFALVVFALVVATVIHGRAVAFLFTTDVGSNHPFREFVRTTHPLWLVAAAVGGAGIHVATVRIGFGFWAVWFLGGLIAASVVTSLATTGGRIDPDSRTFRFGEKSIELDALDGYRRLSLGECTLLWLSYESSVGNFSLPRLVSIPTSLVGDALPLFDAGVAHAIRDERRERNSLATRMLVGLGIGLVGTGVALSLLISARSDELFFAVYIGLMVALFGVLMLWVASARR